LCAVFEHQTISGILISSEPCTHHQHSTSSSSCV
jgi:hypothetical protein